MKFLFFLFLPMLVFTNEFTYKLSYFVDKDNLSFEEVKTKTYINIKNNHISEGYNKNTIWLKVEIKNKLDKNIRKILSMDKTNTELIDFYDETNLLVETGTHRNNANKEIYSMSFAFHVDILANSTKTYYLKMNIKGPFLVAFSVDNEKEFSKKSKLKEFFLLFFFGFLVSVILYNLFLFLTLKEDVYIYYILFQVVTLLMLLHRSGLGLYILWADSFAFNNFIITYIVQLESMFAFFFIISFLDLKHNFPKLYMASIIGIILSIISSMGYSVYYINTIIMVSSLSLALFTIFYSVHKDIAGSKIFLLALFLFIVGALLSVLSDAGILEPNFFIKWSMFTGSMIEAIIFSIALARRIDILKIQKQEALDISKKELKNQVKQKTKKISTLLDNSSQGFLTLDNNFFIEEEYSQKCEDILGDHIAHKSISSVLFQDTSKPSKFEEDLKDILEAKNKFGKRLLISLLPQEIAIRDKILEMEYKILDNKKFLLIITDISEKKMFESKIKKKQNILQMIVSIVSNTNLFFDVKNNFENLANNPSSYITMNKKFSQNINDIYSVIHTFKGSFSQFYMSETVDLLHNVESRITYFKKNTTTNAELVDFIGNVDFKDFMKKDLKSVTNLLGKDFLLLENFILVDKNKMDKIREKVLLLKNTYENDTNAKDVFKDIKHLLKYNLKSILKQYVGFSMQLATKLNKEIYEFEVKGDNNVVILDKYKPFIQSLVHIFRNIIDHGIEFPDYRENRNKDRIGNVLCSFKLENKDLQITISDDGSGIDTQKIKDRILTNSSKQIDVSSLSDEEIHNHILEHGFSTADNITQLSGRGVGLSAVYQEINKLNGSIKIQSKINIGTTFLLTVPIERD